MALRRGKRNTGRNEIFCRLDPQVGGSLHSDVTLVTWATVVPARSALLAQDLCLVSEQQITRLYEIGTPRTFYVVGAASGILQAGRISAPRALIAQFYQAYTPPYQLAPALSCQPRGSPAPDHTAVQGWDLSGVEISGVGLQVTNGDIAVQEQVAGHFDEVSDAKAR